MRIGEDRDVRRLLCIVSSMNTGGAETFLMKIYRAVDKNKYQMDFCCMSAEEGFYENEIKRSGGRIFHIPSKTGNPFKSLTMLKDIVKKNKYRYVMRVSQHSLATLDLLAAKLGGAKVLVMRSSNSDSDNQINRVLHSLFRWLTMIIPTVRIAPSTEAAEYTFGHNCLNNGKAAIIKNAIDMNEFIFDPQRREKIRKEFKVDEKFVVGHVGRFNNQKNHQFLVEIFAEIVKKNEKSILVLVGQGELESDIKDQIERLGLTQQVIFSGVRADVADVMMGMDILAFPSFFEGMPNVIIEAQATGLQCIISDSITKEVNISHLVQFVSLESDAKMWADQCLRYKQNYERRNMKDIIKSQGYDVKQASDQLVSLIFGLN